MVAQVLEKADLPDVTHAPASLGGFLKSGLGRFGLQVVRQVLVPLFYRV